MLTPTQEEGITTQPDERVEQEEVEVREDIVEVKPEDTPQPPGDSASPPYTREELKRTDFEKVDVKRLPPEIQEVFKGLQASYGKKVSALRQQYEQGEHQPPVTWAEIYEADPDRTLAVINQEIRKLHEEMNANPYDAEKMASASKKSKELEFFKEELRHGYEKEQRIRAQMLEVAQREIPDYFANREKVTNFLLEMEPSLTIEDINFLTDPIPRRMGQRRALAMTKLAYRLYNELQENNLKKKAVPPKLESPGTGVTKKPDNLEGLLERVKKEGTTEAWAKYIEAKGG